MRDATPFGNRENSRALSVFAEEELNAVADMRVLKHTSPETEMEPVHTPGGPCSQPDGRLERVRVSVRFGQEEAPQGLFAGHRGRPLSQEGPALAVEQSSLFVWGQRCSGGQDTMGSELFQPLGEGRPPGDPVSRGRGP